MKLGTVKTIFDKLPNEDYVFKKGICEPHSYRGFYDELAFDYAEGVTLRQVKISIERACTESFTGYKGGEYEYDYSTPVHFASYGGYSEDSEEYFEKFVGGMLIDYLSNN